ncbi:MAG TPA: Dam family site-specific DNA-(adenine-N6)-methyltransferase [Planctomycetota bacterium]|nr:Dam family site-specific DNA-(adenine-N6)-methyltransferase [Planctomycetota bacterium]HRR78891.1 Dam family site-specific DNA-(adenine-N6)-methyltransferase [Planctomycetota bacterium]
MTVQPLPRAIRRVLVPPIKCQGIKTKLVPFILRNIRWDGQGAWVEPFLGSGVVLFNVLPQRALACDSNPHLIRFYQATIEGRLTPRSVGEHLTREGERLAALGERHYYAVRDRFNEAGDPLDFLLLNRACFNGVMRFNRRGGFNVPFCRKTERFQQAYVTKIVNQVAALQDMMRGRQWEFRCVGWREALSGLSAEDFAYLDPPYVGRHTDYFSQWSEKDAAALAGVARELPCGFALSMWKENRYRSNDYIRRHWAFAVERTATHFYHVGPTESLRNAMVEALLVKPGYEAPLSEFPRPRTAEQMSLAFAH